MLILPQFNKCILCVPVNSLFNLHTTIWTSNPDASIVQRVDMIACHSTPVHKAHYLQSALLVEHIINMEYSTVLPCIQHALLYTAEPTLRRGCVLSTGTCINQNIFTAIL